MKEEADGQEREGYVHGYSREQTRAMSARKAESYAGFSLPYLRKGMRLLDCGCGPGTITLDLAEAVAPGQVIGIDVEEAQIEAAKVYAAEEKIINVRFETGDVYELRFADGSFDAVFAHAVLEHLTEPLRALREIHRVLVPGGIVGLRHGDWDGSITYPSLPVLDRATDLYERVWKHNGGDPRFGKRQKRLLREAGFTMIRVSASFNVLSTPEELRALAENFGGRFTKSSFVDQVLELGWANEPTLREMADGFYQIAEHLDAFVAMAWIEAVGWKE